MTSALDAFKLYYEHHENCPMVAAEQRCKQERRDLIAWIKRELGFVLLTYGTKRRNYVKH